MKTLLFLIIAMGVGSCAPNELARAAIPDFSKEEIRYLSSDLAHVAIFSATDARFGPPDLANTGGLWGSSKAHYFDVGNVQCVSIGIPENAVEFAVKRPITAGDRYKCLNTTFEVKRCFEDCKSAIILRELPLRGNSKGSTLTSYFYVDSCFGVLVFSSTDLRSGIPLDAEWLRGSVGILADKSYPTCSRF